MSLNDFGFTDADFVDDPDDGKKPLDTPVVLPPGADGDRDGEDAQVEAVTAPIRGCARCGRDHEIKFQRFTGQPFEDSDGTLYEWWGLCSNTGDPVLLNVRHPEVIESASHFPGGE